MLLDENMGFLCYSSGPIPRKETQEVSFSIPYPRKLSVNRYLSRTKTGVHKNPLVARYNAEVFYIVRLLPRFEGKKINLSIQVFPPDNRKMDLDNCLKVVLDALQYAGLFNNDNQVDGLYVRRCEIVENGRLDIVVKELQAEDAS